MNLKEMLLDRYVKSSIGVEHLLGNGRVKLNGHVTTNSRIPADERDDIQIDGKHLDENNDYWSFMLKDDEYSLVSKGDTVMFFGCNAEGRPKYCKDKGADVFLIGLAMPDGYKTIEENPIRVSYDQVFEKTKAKADLMVVDAKIDVIKSMEIVQNNISLCADHGKVLVYLDNGERDNEGLEGMSRKFMEDMGIEIEKVFEGKNGITILGRK